MAGLVPAIATGISAATDGRVKPGHDGLVQGPDQASAQMPTSCPGAKLRLVMSGLRLTYVRLNIG